MKLAPTCAGSPTSVGFLATFALCQYIQVSRVVRGVNICTASDLMLVGCMVNDIYLYASCNKAMIHGSVMY
jgi:hypothetical protein